MIIFTNLTKIYIYTASINGIIFVVSVKKINYILHSSKITYKRYIDEHVTYYESLSFLEEST
jgi:RecA-family ATPase